LMKMLNKAGPSTDPWGVCKSTAFFYNAVDLQTYLNI